LMRNFSPKIAQNSPKKPWIWATFASSSKLLYCLLHLWDFFAVISITIDTISISIFSVRWCKFSLQF
jgi:hypothetical protein